MKICCIGRVVVASSLAALGSSAHATLIFGAETSGYIADIYSFNGQTNSTTVNNGGENTPLSAFQIDDAVTPDFFGNGPWNRGFSHGFAALNLGVQAMAEESCATFPGFHLHFSPGKWEPSVKRGRLRQDQGLVGTVPAAPGRTGTARAGTDRRLDLHGEGRERAP